MLKRSLPGQIINRPSRSQLSSKLRQAAKAPDFKIKPGFLYTVVRAISARVNQNYDGWPSHELKRSYHTFLGKPCFVNHENFDPHVARGVVVAARYMENGPDKYVEVIQEIDAARFPKLAREIKSGGMDSVSMGAEAGYTICSYCDNYATEEEDMCDHVRFHKGEYLPDDKGNPRLVYESCHNLSFFELSYVFDPADETAVVSKVLVAHRSGVEKTSRWVHPDAVRGRQRVAYGEVEAPEAVDTLRQEDDSGEDDFHHYIDPPKELRDPDFDRTKRIDRAQEDAGMDADRVSEDAEEGGMIPDPNGSGPQDNSENPIPAQENVDQSSGLPYMTIQIPMGPDDRGPSQPFIGRHSDRLGERREQVGPDTRRTQMAVKKNTRRQRSVHNSVPTSQRRRRQAGGFPVDVTDQGPPQDLGQPMGGPPPGGPPPGGPPPAGPPPANGNGLPQPDFGAGDELGGDEMGFDQTAVDPMSLDDATLMDTLDALEEEAGARGLDIEGGEEGGDEFDGGYEDQGEFGGPPESPPEEAPPPFPGEPEEPERREGRRYPRRRPMAQTLASRGRQASQRRRHFAEGPLSDSGDRSENDQGVQEDVFISQTPPEEGVVAPNDSNPISNTEENLVASLNKAKEHTISLAKRLHSLQTKKAADRREKLTTIARSHPNPEIRKRAQTVLAEEETPDIVNPTVNTGPAAEALTGDNFQSADPNDGVQETQPKDASRKWFAEFDQFLKKTTGRNFVESVKAGKNTVYLRRQAERYARERKISSQLLFPTLGSALRTARNFEVQSQRGRETMQRRGADDKLDLAAPDGRVDVEAPTSGTTDADAQASQFDIGDFGNNAGDNLADPDLRTDQNWSPGEGKKSSRQMAGAVAALRCARAHIAAGIEAPDREWALVARFEQMHPAMVNQATRILEKVVVSQRQRSQRRTASSGNARGARQSLPSGLGSGMPRVASQQVANTEAVDTLLWLPQ